MAVSTRDRVESSQVESSRVESSRQHLLFKYAFASQAELSLNYFLSDTLSR